jgi:aconitate hydratase 2 / 2-methylisocitrate dehydratase
MLDEYRSHEAERELLGIPPRPLTVEEAEQVASALTTTPAGDAAELLHLLTHRVSPGVGEAAEVKARFLATVATGATHCASIDRRVAVALLGTMIGGYAVPPLVELLGDPALGVAASEALGSMVLVADSFETVHSAASNVSGLGAASDVLRAWADEDWLTSFPPVASELHLTVFKVDGETNTDDLSPATEAWSRADIPLHALSLLENKLGPGVAPAEIGRLAALGRPVAFVGDVVGTGSSRKSSVNSLLWHIGEEIPYVPNKRRGGVVIAGRIAPIFFDTLRDSGALPIECDLEAIATLTTGTHVVVRPAEGRLETGAGDLIATFRLRDDGTLDGVRAGGRTTLIVGRRLAREAARALGRTTADAGRAEDKAGPFTLAQKIVGRACGRAGVSPGDYCEPTVSTVGSQDTTGPMNRTELEDLACLSFGADLVLQTFCHTVGYPRPSDVETQRTLPPFMARRGAIVLRPGDGIIHSWLNKMLLPDQVGTGSDSHTRFPLGISFPAGSGLVALAAALGAMPLTMPESVCIRFSGRRRAGVTIRDVVNAVPYVARREGKPHVFSNRVIEMEGLEDFSVEDAFELTDATAERSAAACTFNFSVESVARHLNESIDVLRGLVAAGYEGRPALERRIAAMEVWLANPTLLRADPNAEYAAVLEIDLDLITEPLLACPNDPDDVRPLSEVAGVEVDEVFIGSCMTRGAHFRAAGDILAGTGDEVPVRLWIAPPTSLVRDDLRREGYYNIYGAAGARTEVPGCSLCMGNQARVAPGSTVVSTSTRNFPNRMGRDARVYLASAEVASLAARLGRLPTAEEYFSAVTAA